MVVSPRSNACSSHRTTQDIKTDDMTKDCVDVASLSRNNAQETMFNIEKAMFNTEETMFDIEESMFNLEETVLNMEETMLNIEEIMLHMEETVFYTVSHSRRQCSTFLNTVQVEHSAVHS